MEAQGAEHSSTSQNFLLLLPFSFLLTSDIKVTHGDL